MFEEVKKVIVESIGCDEDKVTMEAQLVDDLEIDSLDAVELNMALEDAIGRGLTDDELGQVKTVGDIVRLLEAHQDEA